MIKTTILRSKKPRLKNPILIEGLPGVGHVGKLVAEHMVAELGAKKIMEIYSPHFPPQVIVEDDGTVRLVSNELYAYKTKGKHDLLILVGDHQSTTNEGHYELCGVFLDIVEEFKVRRVYTLGGYGVGQLVETDTVLGAANSIELVRELKEYGVEFRANEPGGGIVGASGLMLGLVHLQVFFLQRELVDAVPAERVRQRGGQIDVGGLVAEHEFPRLAQPFDPASEIRCFVGSGPPPLA